MGNQIVKEQLYRSIAKNDQYTINKILEKFPHLVNQELTNDSEMTPLLKAINQNNLQIIELLINKGADVDKCNSKGITPLIMCCIRRNLNLVIYFIQNHEVEENLVSKDEMNVLDYAIFYTVYDIAIYLNNRKMNQIKNPQFYEEIQRKYNTKYVNYPVFILHVEKNLPEQSLPNYLNHVKPIFKDPVVDPRQSWPQMLSRFAKFQNPPLIERDQLPSNLRPENRGILSRARTMIQVSKSEIRPKKTSESNIIQIKKKQFQEDQTETEIKQNEMKISNNQDENNQL